MKALRDEVRQHNNSSFLIVYLSLSSNHLTFISFWIGHWLTFFVTLMRMMTILMLLMMAMIIVMIMLMMVMVVSRGIRGESWWF